MNYDGNMNVLVIGGSGAGKTDVYKRQGVLMTENCTVVSAGK